MTGGTSSVVDGGLDGSMLSDFEAGHAFADFDYCPGEFVAECNGYGFFGDTMRFDGREGWPTEEFVEV